MEDIEMKAQMIEKSGFPRPLGFLLILITMGLVCLVQCAFSQPLTTNITVNKNYFPVVEEETEIQVEAWMIDESYWLKNYKSGFIAEESESEISIEPWMLNFEEFEQKVTDNDPEIEIEEWMYNGSFWLISTNSYITQNEEKDEEIKLEEWMYNLNYWKEVYFGHETEKDK
jgi:hypothetical protein